MLELQNVTHVYPNGVRALDDVTLSIPKGMFGLLGPNGAGKSTLMRTVATLQTPSSGSIRFGDIDVLENPEELRKQLGYLPQDFGVYPRVSAYDMLDHMAVLKGISSSSRRRSRRCSTRSICGACARRRSQAFPAGCASVSALRRR